jgi:hypothetical protein
MFELENTIENKTRRRLFNQIKQYNNLCLYYKVKPIKEINNIYSEYSRLGK